jgi:starch phosphorylase
MKAISNGVLQCTVADGWAAEVAWEGVGWELKADDVSSQFYSLLETEIRPLFFDRNPAGVPEGWVRRMQQSIKLAEQFSTQRMLREYREKLYEL